VNNCFSHCPGATRGTSGQIHAPPVEAIADDGAGLALGYDPGITYERWLPSGLRLTLEIRDACVRWALAYGRIVLNWHCYD
jgi:hypothetical protein